MCLKLAKKGATIVTWDINKNGTKKYNTSTPPPPTEKKNYVHLNRQYKIL